MKMKETKTTKAVSPEELLEVQKLLVKMESRLSKINFDLCSDKIISDNRQSADILEIREDICTIRSFGNWIQLKLFGNIESEKN